MIGSAFLRWYIFCSTANALRKCSTLNRCMSDRHAFVNNCQHSADKSYCSENRVKLGQDRHTSKTVHTSAVTCSKTVSSSVTLSVSPPSIAVNNSVTYTRGISKIQKNIPQHTNFCNKGRL